MVRMRSLGVSVEVPQGWDGEIYRRADLPVVDGVGDTLPIVHLANFPLPAERGDFGLGAVEMMRPDSVMVALVEFGPDSVGTELFAMQGVPTVSPRDFDPNRMQRPLPGQSGAQYFFTQSSRAFCLFIALGSHARRVELVSEVNQVLAGMDIFDSAG